MLQLSNYRRNKQGRWLYESDDLMFMPSESLCQTLDEIERLRDQHRHCDHCGSSWLDDGINSGCCCREIQRLRAALAEARGHETMPCGHNSRWLVYGNPADVNSERHCLFCEVEGLRAIVDRQHSALVVAGFECDELGDCDLHVLALDVAEENEREDGEPMDDDYAEAYMRAVERLRANVAETADCLRDVWDEPEKTA